MLNGSYIHMKAMPSWYKHNEDSWKWIMEGRPWFQHENGSSYIRYMNNSWCCCNLQHSHSDDADCVTLDSSGECVRHYEVISDTTFLPPTEGWSRWTDQYGSKSP